MCRLDNGYKIRSHIPPAISCPTEFMNATHNKQNRIEQQITENIVEILFYILNNATAATVVVVASAL